jgi:hypothetical protein
MKRTLKVLLGRVTFARRHAAP